MKNKNKITHKNILKDKLSFTNVTQGAAKKRDSTPSSSIEGI